MAALLTDVLLTDVLLLLVHPLPTPPTHTFAMMASASSFLKKKNPSWVLFCRHCDGKTDREV